MGGCRYIKPVAETADVHYALGRSIAQLLAKLRDVPAHQAQVVVVAFPSVAHNLPRADWAAGVLD